jgi:hypothetical protein
VKITMLFKGGPWDGGSASLERDLQIGDKVSAPQLAIRFAGTTSGSRFNVGHRFPVPSPGWMLGTVVRRELPPGVFDSFEYAITDQLEVDGEMLVEAKYIGQRPGAENPAPA